MRSFRQQRRIRIGRERKEGRIVREERLQFRIEAGSGQDLRKSRDFACLRIVRPQFTPGPLLFGWNARRDEKDVAVLRGSHHHNRPRLLPACEVEEVRFLEKRVMQVLALLGAKEDDHVLPEHSAQLVAPRREVRRHGGAELESEGEKEQDTPQALSITRRGNRRSHLLASIEEAMEVHFTPEQEAQLSQIAHYSGTDMEQLVKDAALRLVEDDAKFLAGVRRGVDQANRRELLSHRDVKARIEHLLQSCLPQP